MRVAYDCARAAATSALNRSSVALSASPEAFATIRRRLVRAGASDGTVNDFGSVHSMFFRDPGGLEGEVLICKR